VSDDQGKKLFYAKAGGEKTRVIEVIKKGGMQVKGNRERATGTCSREDLNPASKLPL
jgi:hypothetical protein